MHKAFAVLFVAIVWLSATASAEQPKAGSNWQNVQALAPGTVVDVAAATRHVRCTLSAASSGTLTCRRGGSTTKPIEFQRSEVASIKIRHRVRSTLIAAGIGAGAGAITGFALGTGGGSDSFFGPNAFRGAITGVVAGMGTVVGAGVGALTNFSTSTVYKAP